MHSKLEKVSESRVTLEVEVEAAEIEQALDEACARIAQKASIPGFRKGKAPRSILESRYGKGALLEEALDIVFPRTYRRALEEHNLEPIDQPELDVVQQYDEGKSLIYRASVEVIPEVVLGDYASLSVPLETEEVTDEAVAKQLSELQERHASLEPAEKETVENGDFAVIDFEGYLDGQPFQGGAGEGHTLEIGSGTFIPGFEEGITGMRPGEEKEIRVTFPGDYRAEHLAGREAAFKVKVSAIKQKRVPGLDDEFAHEVGFESLEELNNAIRRSLTMSAEQKARSSQFERVVDALVEGARVTVPEKMIEHEIEHHFEDFKNNLESRGLSFERYLEASEKTTDAIKDDLRPGAVKAVKTELVLKALADRENVTVSREELEHEVEHLAHAYRQDSKKLFRRLEKEGRLEGLADRIRRHKAADLIADRASGTAKGE